MIVTRFAPSPTGMLHIGGVRTVLFSWLQARRTDGSGSLSRTEAAGNLGMRPGTAPQGGDDAAFLIADLDFSGDLSRTEFVEAPIPLLASIDANMDSRITQEEIAQARGAMGGRRN